MAEEIKPFIDWCLNHWGLLSVICACFIEITPIFKANPIKMLFSWVGKAMTADVMKEIKTIKEDVATIKEDIVGQQETIDENECDRIRWEILDFANSCRNHRKHTKDEFEHIIVLNTKYEALMDKTGKKNGVYAAEYQYIFELYQRCQRENTFLGGTTNGEQQ